MSRPHARAGLLRGFLVEWGNMETPIKLENKDSSFPKIPVILGILGTIFSFLICFKIGSQLQDAELAALIMAPMVLAALISGLFGIIATSFVKFKPNASKDFFHIAAISAVFSFWGIIVCIIFVIAANQIRFKESEQKEDSKDIS